MVGGGIHGVHITSRLLGSNTVKSKDICIIDANESLLKNWKRRTENTGMEYLRSSAGYHLDLTENSLRFFGNGDQKKSKAKAAEGVFAKDYERPRLDLFNQHCDSVIEKYNLNHLHVQGRVTNIQSHEDHVAVEVKVEEDCRTKTIVYHAENIVLALGNDDPSYANWVQDYDVKNGFVRHLSDVSENQEDTSCDVENGFVAHVLNVDENENENHSVAVVGGGISAVHKVLELSRQENKGSIHLISRHPVKEQQFDTHQDWMMDQAASKRSEKGGGSGTPRKQKMFQKCDCWKERRRIISQERVPGTVTPALNRGENGLKYAIEKEDVMWHQAEIVKKEYVRNDEGKICQLELKLSCGETIIVEEVLLATGFGKKVPGGALIDNLVQNGLRVSEFCGYPIVNEDLMWDKRIYVAGALAELELGPSARNIAGARLAAERILQACA